MIALRFERSVPRYVATRALARRAPGLVASHLAPLRLGHIEAPPSPADGWARVAPRLAGICGSDLAMLTGEASFHFGPLVSMPFVPGHEVVGTLLEDAGDLAEGTRVVIEPVLSCAARGIEPRCGACARGQIGLCERTAHGHLAPGLQTGYCEDTGGGWGQELVAHTSQLHPVPDGLTDADAVLVEPLACAVHAVLRAGVREADTVLVVGAGTMGLLVVAALNAVVPDARVVAVAKHPVQRREAEALGADVVCSPGAALRTMRLLTASMLHTPERGDAWITGGADVTFECAGSQSALGLAVRTTRPRGRVVLVGLPGPGRFDLAPVWHRELEILGAYTYGAEEVDDGVRERLQLADGPVRTFDLAIALAERASIGRLVSARYTLSRYPEAIDHALDAGRLDAVKVTFEPGA